MLLTDISRKQAFLTHLAASSSVFLILAYLIVFVWYPDYYFFLDGGDRAIATIFFVDVVLGPGFTLLVFKPGKKSLKFDMSVILLLQLSALVWGVSNVYTERSAATVFYQGKFTCISQPDAAGIDLQSIESTVSGDQKLGFLQRPDTVDELLDFTKLAFANKSSAIYFYVDQIVPLDDKVVARLDKYRLSIDALREEDASYAEAVDRYRQRGAYKNGNIALYPLACRYGNVIAVYDKEKMRVVDIMDVPTHLSADALDEPLPLKQQLESQSISGTTRS